MAKTTTPTSATGPSISDSIIGSAVSGFKTLSTKLASFEKRFLAGGFPRLFKGEEPVTFSKAFQERVEITKDQINQFGEKSSAEQAESAFISFGVVGAQRSASKVIKSAYRSPAFRQHFQFFKEISATNKFRPPAKATIQEATKKGIATRVTKGGTPVPAVRQSGPFVPTSFAKYKKFKDVKPGALGGTKDATRLLQEIDGALPVRELLKLESQTGPAVKNILHRTRDMTRQKIDLQFELLSNVKVAKGFIKAGSSRAKLSNKVLELIRTADKEAPMAKLLQRKDIAKITKDPSVIRFAQMARNWFDDVLDMQNAMRIVRRQKLIPKRDSYSPNEFLERTIRERVFGLRKEAAEIMGKDSPAMPDYIFPDKPFNPREMARRYGLTELQREPDLVRLMQNYTRTATRDIIDTSIVQNNKAFIQELETLGFENSARSVADWTATRFAGVKSTVDRAANLSPRIEKGMRWWRTRLVKSVFPLNFAWNSFIQTSSITLTGTRYGWGNTVKSAAQWFGNSKVRSDIADNAYSFIIKTLKQGKISQQDINTGITATQKLDRGLLESAEDAANFFTELIERHLTGISVRAAFNDGARRGLKGKALWEYASDGGAKTQSMYNMEDLPGILTSNIVKTTAPFQTFSFEMFNNMREFAGKTGVPPGTAAERIKMVIRFMAGMWTTNTVVSTATGREPWEASSFLPFYGNFVTPIISDEAFELKRAGPSFINVGSDLRKGIQDVIEKEDWSKIRRVAIKYGLPFGGTQVSRTVDAMIAIGKGGVEDSSGRLLFPIVKTKEQMRALFSGVFTTEGGQEFIEKRK